MNVQFSADDLRPIVQVAVAEALERLQAEQARLNGRLAYTQPEAAALVGVRANTLRDARLRGELAGSMVGNKIVYTREELVAFLRRQEVSQ